MLFDVSALDPLALGVACCSMVVVRLFAGLLPASRAAGIEPVRVLREE